MRKLSFYLLSLLVVIGLTFTSCDEDTDPVAPSITLVSETGYTSANATVEPGDSIHFKVDVRKGDAKLVDLTFKRDAIQLEESPYDLEDDSDIVIIATKAPAAAADYTYDFEVTDKDGESASKSVTITVASAVGNVISYTNKTLQAPTGDGTNDNNIASIDGSLFGYADATTDAEQGKADLVYFYGPNLVEEAIICAPNDVPTEINSGYADWNVKNATKFVSASSVNFDAIPADDDTEIVNAVNNPTLSKTTPLSVGDIWGFETASGKKGLFKVTALQEGYNPGDYITIDLKVQE